VLKNEYDDLAAEQIFQLIERELAVVWPEVEAKLAGPPLALNTGKVLPDGINPHHLTNGRRKLLADGRIQQTAVVTRGGGAIPVFVPTNQRRRTRAVADAVSRKRLLYARYLGWAQATKFRPSLVGRAGERVVHNSLLAAASTGYRVDPSVGNVNRLLGGPIVGGSLDAAAHLLTIKNDVPGPTITLPIEVKNIREWVYPYAAELYQLLDKAANLQLRANVPILPVFVCRRAHKTTYKMAKQIGCFVAEAKAQFILDHAEVEDRLLTEVTGELGFTDLEKTERENRLLTSLFRDSIPPAAVEMADRFSLVAPVLARFTADLRDTYVRGPSRKSQMDTAHEVPGPLDPCLPSGRVDRTLPTA
jgi:hypothetical protein